MDESARKRSALQQRPRKEEYKANIAAAVQVLREWAEEKKLGNALGIILGNPTNVNEIMNAVVTALEETHDNEGSHDLLTSALLKHITTGEHLLSIEFSVQTIEKLAACGPFSSHFTKEQFVNSFPDKTKPFAPTYVVAFIKATGRVCLRLVPSTELRQFVADHNMQETTDADEGNFVFTSSSTVPLIFPGEAAEQTDAPQIYFVFQS